jgi:tetratricopeptide (TPR) repeat protein
MGKSKSAPGLFNPLQSHSGIFILLGIATIFWIPALRNGFTNWDDHVYLTDNPLVKNLSWNNIQAIFSSFLMGNYHPLVPLSYALEHSLVGMSPFLYHLNNLLLHLGSTYVLYLILNRFTQSIPGSLAGAILFVLHPIHVESVAWVTERKDVLYTLFFLLATLKWMDYKSNGNKKAYAYSILFFILSCLSKGMAVVWPFCLILIELIPNWGKTEGTIAWKKLQNSILSLILPLTLGIGFGVLTIFAQRSEGAVRAESPFLFPDNILIASRSILFYLEKTIAPIGLSAFYPYPEPARTFPIYWYLSPALVISILVLIVFLIRKNLYPLAAALGLYLIIIFPVSQILPVGSAFAADRYFYLSSIGISLFLAYLWKFYETRITKQIGLIILSAMTLTWGVMTWNRSGIWNSTETLFLDVIKTYPNVPVAYNNIGNVYETKKEYQVAKGWYLQAVRVKPNYPEGLMNMGVVYERLNQFDSALYYYYTLKEYHPQHPKIHNVIANASNKFGNRQRESGDYQSADSLFRLSLQWDKNYTEAWNNLGNLAFSKGQIDSGIIFLKEAVRINPVYAEAWSNLGSIYGATGKIDSAVVCFQKAVDINPEYGPAWFNLGYALRLIGKETEGMKAIQNAAQKGHAQAQQFLNQAR